MYEIREVMALFGFVQSLGFCTEFWDKLGFPETQESLGKPMETQKARERENRASFRTLLNAPRLTSLVILYSTTLRHSTAPKVFQLIIKSKCHLQA